MLDWNRPMHETNFRVEEHKSRFESWLTKPIANTSTAMEYAPGLLWRCQCPDALEPAYPLCNFTQRWCAEALEVRCQSFCKHHVSDSICASSISMINDLLRRMPNRLATAVIVRVFLFLDLFSKSWEFIQPDVSSSGYPDDPFNPMDHHSITS